MKMLADGPSFSQLERLLLHPMQGNTLQPFVESGRSSTLTHLALSGAQLETDISQLLCKPENFSRLHSLKLNFTQTHPRELSQLASSGLLWRLRALDLSCTYAGDSALSPVLSNLNPSRLRFLSLANSEISDKTVHALLQLIPEGLEVLDLSSNDAITEDAVLTLLSSRHTASLRVLCLGGLSISRRTLKHLLNSDFPHLEQLDISNAVWDPEDFNELVRQRHHFPALLGFNTGHFHPVHNPWELHFSASDSFGLKAPAMCYQDKRPTAAGLIDPFI